MTLTGTEAHRLDCATARLEREEQLLDEYTALTTTIRQRDGHETRRARRLSYALYNIHRHHDRKA